MHLIHIDRDTNRQRYSINPWRLAYLQQVSEDSTERRGSSANQLHWILMTDIFYIAEIAEKVEKEFNLTLKLRLV